MTIELDHLVPGLAAGKDAAYSDLYDLMAGPLLAFAQRMLRDRGAAEDAVQQAFVEFARHATTFEGDGRSLRSWLYKSVRFSVLDEVRRRKRRPEQPTETLPEGSVYDVVELGMDPAMEAALAALTANQRAVVLLRHVHGFDGQEIARILGMTRAGVYATGTRAETTLRKTLETVESLPSSASQQARKGPRAPRTGTEI